jgi:hypothetical protein
VYTHTRLLPALALALLAATGCAADDGGPVFDNQGGGQITCMKHQPEPPGSRYTDPQRRNTAELFAVLRYYTAHGTKPYCDKAPPTGTDRTWATFYVRQAADPSHVEPLLDGPQGS